MLELACDHFPGKIGMLELAYDHFPGKIGMSELVYGKIGILKLLYACFHWLTPVRQLEGHLRGSFLMFNRREGPLQLSIATLSHLIPGKKGPFCP